MNFPSYGEIQLMHYNLRASSIAAAITKARPGLTPLVNLADGVRARIEVPDADRRVVCGIGRSGDVVGVIIAGATTTRLVHTVWPLSTDDEIIASSAIDMWEHCAHGTPLSSPLKWGEETTSLAVQLADSLLQAGVAVEAVAAGSGFVEKGVPGGPKTRLLPSRASAAVLVSTEDHTLTFWESDDATWHLDACDYLDAYRLRRLRPAQIEALTSACLGAIAASRSMSAPSLLTADNGRDTADAAVEVALNLLGLETRWDHEGTLWSVLDPLTEQTPARVHREGERQISLSTLRRRGRGPSRSARLRVVLGAGSEVAECSGRTGVRASSS
ncbi:hypothetical protein [Cellulomonas marina]|uniref:Uncharacterized protein n=1 Tax=Cellulomonas marina TaxID=988821 RepID=A0A1I1A787_9CELL|nr:hypothetical protein [Cellulomonas marina]GIG29572.1 hypothetical protein Cma02nite_21720 [Cellulomonas marina]SFB33226.1 hypothetical protein SAMN05421867_11542 [Cellulomonas marina]